MTEIGECLQDAHRAWPYLALGPQHLVHHLEPGGWQRHLTVLLVAHLGWEGYDSYYGDGRAYLLVETSMVPGWW